MIIMRISNIKGNIRNMIFHSNKDHIVSFDDIILRYGDNYDIDVVVDRGVPWFDVSDVMLYAHHCSIHNNRSIYDVAQSNKRPYKSFDFSPNPSEKERVDPSAMFVNRAGLLFLLGDEKNVKKCRKNDSFCDVSGNSSISIADIVDANRDFDINTVIRGLEIELDHECAKERLFRREFEEICRKMEKSDKKIKKLTEKLEYLMLSNIEEC